MFFVLNSDKINVPIMLGFSHHFILLSRNTLGISTGRNTLGIHWVTVDLLQLSVGGQLWEWPGVGPSQSCRLRVCLPTRAVHSWLTVGQVSWYCLFAAVDHYSLSGRDKSQTLPDQMAC